MPPTSASFFPGWADASGQEAKARRAHSITRRRLRPTSFTSGHADRVVSSGDTLGFYHPSIHGVGPRERPLGPAHRSGPLRPPLRDFLIALSGFPGLSTTRARPGSLVQGPRPALPPPTDDVPGRLTRSRPDPYSVSFWPLAQALRNLAMSSPRDSQSLRILGMYEPPNSPMTTIRFWVNSARSSPLPFLTVPRTSSPDLPAPKPQ